jgi:hypothetical protein
MKFTFKEIIESQDTDPIANTDFFTIEEITEMLQLLDQDELDDVGAFIIELLDEDEIDGDFDSEIEEEISEDEINERKYFDRKQREINREKKKNISKRKILKRERRKYYKRNKAKIKRKQKLYRKKARRRPTMIKKHRK